MTMDLKYIYDELDKLKKNVPNIFELIIAISKTEAKLNEICTRMADLSIGDTDIEELMGAISNNHIDRDFLKKFLDDANNIDYSAIVLKKVLKRRQSDFGDFLLDLIKDKEEKYTAFIGKVFKEKKPEIEEYLWEMVEDKVQKAVGKKVFGAWATIILILITLLLLGFGVVTTSSNLMELSDKVKEVTSSKTPKKTE